MKIPANLQSKVRRLSEDFEAFRAKARPGAKIPEELRREVIKAIDAGAEPTALRSVLGVTNSQVASWRRGSRVRADNVSRVLEVVPSAASMMAPGIRVSYEHGRLSLEVSF